MSIPLGENCHLYYSGTAATTTTYTLPSTELSNVSNVQISGKIDTPEYTTRANGGIKQYAASLSDFGITFNIIKTSSTDAGFLAVRAAYTGKTEIAIYALDGVKAVTGSEGPCGNWIVADFSRDESNGTVVTYKVELKPSSFNAWHTES